MPTTYEVTLLKDLAKGLVRENKSLRETIEALKEAVAIADLNISFLEKLLRESENERVILRIRGQN